MVAEELTSFLLVLNMNMVDDFIVFAYNYIVKKEENHVIWCNRHWCKYDQVGGL